MAINSLMPEWKYRPFPGHDMPLINPFPDSRISPRLMAGFGPPDRWINEDLQLEVEAIDEESYLPDEEPPGTIIVYRWEGRGLRFVCYAGDGLRPRDVILALSKVRPQPSKPKDWEAAIKKAVKARS